MSAPIIETDGLAKHYRKRWSGQVIRAVDGISLQVGPGTAFGLLGPNGSGKTTFVKLLLTSLHPTTGSARLFGRDNRHWESRRSIGYLPENHRFPTYNTGYQMLDFYAALSGLPTAERRRRAGELLELVGLAPWAGVRIGKYSKGMLQRLGLAQAMMHRPALLILDEPTDGVDPVGRRQIREILTGLRRAGTTIFLNSHLLSEVELFCDEVAIISGGKVAVSGKLADLTAGAGYRVSAATPSNGIVNVHAADRRALNETIDRLRAAGAEIDSVTPVRSTLEDVFVRTVEGGE
jgi:ABC-2 type transport system ATP-binding protein